MIQHSWLLWRPNGLAPFRVDSEHPKELEIRDQQKLGIKYEYAPASMRGIVHDKILRVTLRSAASHMEKLGFERLLLAGRDVWVYAILCERMHIPYLYLPAVSRLLCRDAPALREYLQRSNVKKTDSRCSFC